MKRNRNEFKRLAKGSCWLPHFILFAKSTEKSLNCLSTWNFLRTNIEEKKKWRRRQKYEKLRHSYHAITPTSRQKYTATSKNAHLYIVVVVVFFFVRLLFLPLLSIPRTHYFSHGVNFVWRANSIYISNFNLRILHCGWQQKPQMKPRQR